MTQDCARILLARGTSGRGGLGFTTCGWPRPDAARCRARRATGTVVASMGDAVQIRGFRESDLDAIVEFSLRAWDPVFASLRDVLGDPIFFRLKPDWKAAQAEEVRASCTSGERDAFVAVVDGRPVGFVTVALNAFNDGMGVIDIIGVDPDFQRRGIASQLTEHALDHMRRCGMDIAAVGTGGDPGHAPARAAYESFGFTLLPSARYLKLLNE